MSSHSAYFFALMSALLFSGASVVFAQFTRTHSAIWMNVVKNSVALIAFALTSLALAAVGFEHYGDLARHSIYYFLLSGFLGLAVGDLFLFQAFRRIGSARTIMLFSFQPFLLSLEGYLFFGQRLSSLQLYALLLMLACVWTISYEKFRTAGHWEWRGILYAVIGVLLDNVGVVLSRRGLDLSPGTNAFTANMFRAFAAVLPFLLLQRFIGEKLELARLSLKEKKLAFFSSFIGTFLSLSCWLTALKVGHIGSLAGVGSFNPVAAAGWEWALGKKRPTVYFLVALGFFLGGFLLLLKA